MAAKKRKKAVSKRKVATKTGKRKTSKRKAVKKAAKRAVKTRKKAAKKAAKRAIKSSKARKKAAKLGSRSSAGRRRKAKGERRKATPRKRPAKKRVAKAKKRVAKAPKRVAKAPKRVAKAPKRVAKAPKRVAAKRPKRQVLKRPHGEIFRISKFDKEQYDEGEDLFDERRMIVSHANTMSNDGFAEAFYKYFENFALTQNVGDYDEIDIYRFGVLVKVVGDYSQARVGELIKIAIKILERWLPVGWVAHVVNEVDSVSIRIGMGHYTETISLTHAYNEMVENQKRLVKLLTAFDESMDEIHWFAFADVDLSWDRNTP